MENLFVQHLKPFNSFDEVVLLYLEGLNGWLAKEVKYDS